MEQREERWERSCDEKQDKVMGLFEVGRKREDLKQLEERRLEGKLVG